MVSRSSHVWVGLCLVGAAVHFIRRPTIELPGSVVFPFIFAPPPMPTRNRAQARGSSSLALIIILFGSEKRHQAHVTSANLHLSLIDAQGS